MRHTLSVQQDDAEDAPEDLDADDEHAAPPEEALGAAAGDEDAAPVEQDGGLEKREHGRVAAAVDENEVEWPDEVAVAHVPLVHEVAGRVDHAVAGVGGAPVRSLGGQSGSVKHSRLYSGNRKGTTDICQHHQNLFGPGLLPHPDLGVESDKEEEGRYDHTERRHEPGEAILVRWIVEVRRDACRRLESWCSQQCGQLVGW